MSLRQEWAESSRLAWAFAISMVLHLLFFGGYELGHKLHWWENAHWPAWLAPLKKLTEAARKQTTPQALQPQPPKEPPLLFVEVSPAQETAEPPKAPKFYSSRNSQAANPKADQDTAVPKITGQQTHVIKTEDVPRTKLTPLQPTPPAPKPEPEQPELKPKPKPPPGDLAMGKADLQPLKDPGEAPHRRPRRLSEVRPPADNRLAGEKMKQDGGVRRHLDISSLDAKATAYGAYDYAFVQAVQQKWFSLLDEQQYALEGRGKVVLQFQLHSDGRISDLKMIENTVGTVLGLLCQEAILSPQPFPVWTKEMRLNLEDPRNVQFTFYYD